MLFLSTVRFCLISKFEMELGHITRKKKTGYEITYNVTLLRARVMFVPPRLP
jgi:hypothetical protein